MNKLVLLMLVIIVFDDIASNSFRVFAQIDQEGSGESGEVCNLEGSTCPSDKCCTDSMCENEQYRCCDIPNGYNRQTFVQYIAQQGSDCASCPKCGK